jgi:ankyrin repeat protein
VVKLLMEKGVNPNSKDCRGCTPLSYATWNDHEAVVKLLLEKGVDPDPTDRDGRTPLFYAA